MQPRYHKSVSIPVGFSSPLQRSRLQACWTPTGESFNPCRVFKSAATVPSLKYSLDGGQFQSLSGFQVRCNSSVSALCWTKVAPFQSLSGFQVRCNPEEVQELHRGVIVSIPVGFSSPLQRQSLPESLQPAGRFQSLSGFQVRCNVPVVEGTVLLSILFQSLSGFQVRCNIRSVSE